MEAQGIALDVFSRFLGFPRTHPIQYLLRNLASESQTLMMVPDPVPDPVPDYSNCTSRATIHRKPEFKEQNLDD